VMWLRNVSGSPILPIGLRLPPCPVPFEPGV
jgi:hypothetical protein